MPRPLPGQRSKRGSWPARGLRPRAEQGRQGPPRPLPRAVAGAGAGRVLSPHAHVAGPAFPSVCRAPRPHPALGTRWPPSNSDPTRPLPPEGCGGQPDPWVRESRARDVSCEPGWLGWRVHGARVTSRQAQLAHREAEAETVASPTSGGRRVPTRKDPLSAGGQHCGVGLSSQAALVPSGPQRRQCRGPWP